MNISGVLCYIVNNKWILVIVFKREVVKKGWDKIREEMVSVDGVL